MKANLKLERIDAEYGGIGGGYLATIRMIDSQLVTRTLLEGIKKHNSCWVAEIIGRDPKYKYARCFLHGKVDYAHSNSKGTRGVYLNFILEDGHIYDVSSPQSWKKTDRYYCKVINGEIIQIKEEEVEEWLKNR
jgi:hypothetical protein